MFSIYLKESKTVEVDGVLYEYTDPFDRVLKLFALSGDENLSDYDKLELMALLMFDNDPKVSEALQGEDWELLVNLYVELMKKLTGKEEKPEGDTGLVDIDGNPIVFEDGFIPEEETSPRLFSFTEDSEAIFSSFYQQYGIDLIEQQGKLEWGKFQALLNGLGEDTPLGRLIKIRSYSEEEDKRSYKSQMRELQSKVRLKNNQI